jgi:hypothetical protein
MAAAHSEPINLIMPEEFARRVEGWMKSVFEVDDCANGIVADSGHASSGPRLAQGYG